MIVSFRRRQVELVRGLYICDLFEQGHKLRQIEELCETGAGAIAGSLRRKLYGSLCFSKRACPTIKVVETIALECEVLEIPLHGVKLRH